MSNAKIRGVAYVLVATSTVSILDAAQQKLDMSPIVLQQRIATQMVVVRATFTSYPACENAESWRWGAGMTCPKKAIASLSVTWGSEALFVPVSAFIDLAWVRSMELTSTDHGFALRISGGDAAESYDALLEFGGDTIEKAVLLRRLVRGGEFPDQAWEETRYHFVVEEPGR